MRPLLFALPLVAVAACTPTGDPDSTSDALATSYGSFTDVLQGAEYDQWLAVRSALVARFDRVCGDTFCSGDFSNLRHVRLACSATSAMHKMKDCVWVLAGSIEYVHPVTGAFTHEARTFACKVPVAGTAKTMLAALTTAGDDALFTALPGTSGSFYDAIGTCMEGVVGNLPPAPIPGPYRPLRDFLDEGGGDGDGFRASKNALFSSFDDVCGDAFCEGEYSDISPIDFSCNVDTVANKVRKCSFTFGLANTDVDSKGKLVTDATIRSCDVALYVNPSTLLKALAVADPLRARLPGKTTSIYDSLVGCL